MLDLLKRLIAGRELAALNRYRYACHLVHRWMGNHLAAAESAEWIRQFGEGKRGADISQFRGRVENALAMRAPAAELTGRSPAMVGRMIEGDFEKGTITFQMEQPYYLAAGRYALYAVSDQEQAG